MHRAASFVVVLSVIAGGAATRARGQVSAVPPAETRPRTAVLVELFTAEGCSSCPPADRLLEGMLATQPAPGVLIVGLGEHVDYWDRLGWKDRFSSAAFTARQEAYAARLETRTIYTPQIVVDGASALVGTDVAALRRAIEQAAAAPHGILRVDVAGSPGPEVDVTMTAADLPPLGGGDRAEVVVAVTEDRLRSDVKRGENAGKVLTHAAVVRSMSTVGPMPSPGGTVRTRVKIAADWNREQLTIAAFVQARQSRRVLATAVVPLTGAGVRR